MDGCLRFILDFAMNGMHQRGATRSNVLDGGFIAVYLLIPKLATLLSI